MNAGQFVGREQTAGIIDMDRRIALHELTRMSSALGSGLLVTIHSGEDLGRGQVRTVHLG